jgi:hypothetical protein
MEITQISKAEQALARATTPEQSRNVEAVASAAKAWAREQGDFETVVGAAHVYILARRKTTELIAPKIRPGQNGRETDANVSFLEDFGFTQKQWSRRLRELELEPDDIENYFAECIERGAEPTTAGLLRFAGFGSTLAPRACECGTTEVVCASCGKPRKGR